MVYEARLIHDVQRRFDSSPEDVAHLYQLMESLSRRFVSVAHLDDFPAIGVIVDYPPSVGELDDVELPESSIGSNDVGSLMDPLDLDTDDFFLIIDRHDLFLFVSLLT